jgi:hypothetical protein
MSASSAQMTAADCALHADDESLGVRSSLPGHSKPFCAGRLVLSGDSHYVVTASDRTTLLQGPLGAAMMLRGIRVTAEQDG